jgi:uncharacterized membrane protein
LKFPTTFKITLKKKVATKTLNKAFGKLDEQGWEVVKTNIEKGTEKLIKGALNSNEENKKEFKYKSAGSYSF